MTLADTSVWIEHFHGREDGLLELLPARRVLMHPFVLGELACGNLPRRAATIVDLGSLPMIPIATDAEVLQAIEAHRWYGQGIGFLDAHLLASCLLAKVPLWTRDERLHNLARSLNIAM